LIVAIVGGSLGFGIGHVLGGGVDKVVIVGDLGRQLVNQWDKDVVDLVGGLGDVRVGRSDSVSDLSGKDVVIVGLEGPFLHFHVFLELEVLEEISESSLQFIKGTTK